MRDLSTQKLRIPRLLEATDSSQFFLMKQKSKSKSVTDDDNDSDSLNTGKLMNKQKQELIDQKVTVYIHIQSTSPPLRLAATLKNKAKPPLPPVSVKGPCFIHVQQSYNEFWAVLAKELPCKLKHLPSNLISWKYEKPAIDAKKPLASLSRFEALIISLKEKRAGYVIIVFMPPPKVEDVVCHSLSLFMLLCLFLILWIWCGTLEMVITLQNLITITRRLHLLSH